MYVYDTIKNPLPSVIIYGRCPLSVTGSDPTVGRVPKRKYRIPRQNVYLIQNDGFSRLFVPRCCRGEVARQETIRINSFINSDF